MVNPISNQVRAIVIGSWIAGLLLFEKLRALRPVHRSKIKRDVRNLVIAAPAGLIMQALEMPVAFKLAEMAQTGRLGLIPRLHLPLIAATVVAILLLDNTLYWWHYLTHRVPLLWRFHQVHHLDQEMDATTALRFHFGEIAISVGFRAVQIAAIGPLPIAVALWQVFLFLCILFHHSNVRLPLELERRLALLLITPRLHGIHHSIVPGEVNSNWSSGLTVWDILHGTLRTDVPQKALTLGVSGFLEESEDTVGRALLLPFDGAAAPPQRGEEPAGQSLDRLT